MVIGAHGAHTRGDLAPLEKGLFGEILDEDFGKPGDRTDSSSVVSDREGETLLEPGFRADALAARPHAGPLLTHGDHSLAGCG